MGAQIITGTERDLFDVLADLRPIDWLEVSLTASDPVESLVRGWRRSSFRGIGVIDGLPVVAFGVVPSDVQPGDGSPWMVATPRITEISRQFLRESRHVVEAMRCGYTDLRNATHHENTISLAWLAWLGFRINPEPVGPGGLFRMFSMPGKPAKE